MDYTIYVTHDSYLFDLNTANKTLTLGTNNFKMYETFAKKNNIPVREVIDTLINNNISVTEKPKARNSFKKWSNQVNGENSTIA